MESLEILQEDTTSGWWALIHNGRRIYRSDALSGIISWMRSNGQFKEWETVTLHIQPREQIDSPMFTS